MHAEKVITRDTLCMILSLAVCHMWQCELHAMHALVLSASSLQYPRIFIVIFVLLWNDLADPVFDCVGLVGFKSKTRGFLLASAAALLFSLLSFLSMG